MKLTLSSTKHETSEITAFIFEPERPLQWSAGQFLRYVLNHPNPDDRGVIAGFDVYIWDQCYSME